MGTHISPSHRYQQAIYAYKKTVTKENITGTFHWGRVFCNPLSLSFPKPRRYRIKVLRIPHDIVKDPLIWFEFILKKGSFGACLNHF